MEHRHRHHGGKTRPPPPPPPHTHTHTLLRVLFWPIKLEIAPPTITHTYLCAIIIYCDVAFALTRTIKQIKLTEMCECEKAVAHIQVQGDTTRSVSLRVPCLRSAANGIDQQLSLLKYQ